MKHDIPAGEFRWITVTSPEGPEDLDLTLEPNANPAGKAFQRARFDQRIPVAAFEVEDIAGEFRQLTAHSVASRGNRWQPVRSPSPCRHVRQSDSVVSNDLAMQVRLKAGHYVCGAASRPPR